MKCPNSGLYAITQTDNKSVDKILSEVTAVLRGGVAMLQYRDKNPVDGQALAKALLEICHQYHVPLIINDDITLAEQIGADGVHLGKQDGNIKEARAILGADAIIGISCYNFIELALDAQKQGASYVAFGRFFPSLSKPLAAPADIETLQKAKFSLTIPVVAIGGILPENGAQLLTAGADMLAVIGGLFDSTPEQSAKAYRALFI